MSAVSETIVREFFESRGYLVRQHRKFISPHRLEDEEFDFLIQNPRPESAPGPLPFLLGPADLGLIDRAVVVVKGWHTETFSHGMLTHAPEIFRFVEPEVFQQAARQFGVEGVLSKILVVPALPQGEEAQQQSIDYLRAKGVDAVILFRAILSDLIDNTKVNRNYQKSDLLQIIRILKNYDFFREPQLELFRSGSSRRTSRQSGKGIRGPESGVPGPESEVRSPKSVGG